MNDLIVFSAFNAGELYYRVFMKEEAIPNVFTKWEAMPNFSRKGRPSRAEAPDAQVYVGNVALLIFKYVYYSLLGHLRLGRPVST